MEVVYYPQAVPVEFEAVKTNGENLKKHLDPNENQEKNNKKNLTPNHIKFLRGSK